MTKLTCRTCKHCRVIVEVGDEQYCGGFQTDKAQVASGICQVVPPQPVMVEYGIDSPCGHDLQWHQPEVLPDETVCGLWSQLQDEEPK